MAQQRRTPPAGGLGGVQDCRLQLGGSQALSTPSHAETQREALQRALVANAEAVALGRGGWDALALSYHHGRIAGTVTGRIAR